MRLTEDGIAVAFQKKAAFYELKKSHPQFASYEQQLRLSQENKELVKIEADADQMEIMTLSR